MVVPVTQRRWVFEDLVDERVGPGVVRGARRGRERTSEEELEDGLTREVELAAEERGVERGVEPRVGCPGDRRGCVGGALEPCAALRRRLGEARGQVAFAEIFHELIPGAVVRHEARDAHASPERRVRRDPSAPRVRFVGGIHDADERAVVGEVDPEVSASPDVADERLDRGRRAELPAGEGFQSGGVGREQRR